MPMSNDAKFEKVQRLLTAHGRTKKTLENEPVVWELHPGTDIAQNWPVITAAYGGLEQTIKYLTAEEKGLTVQELFDFAVAENGQANEDCRRNYPYRTHNLGRLFSRLEERTKKTVREVFKRYKSLFPQIRIGSVDQFLHRVSGGKRRRRRLGAVALRAHRRENAAQEQPGSTGRHLGGVRPNRTGEILGTPASAKARR